MLKSLREIQSDNTHPVEKIFNCLGLVQSIIEKYQGSELYEEINSAISYALENAEKEKSRLYERKSKPYSNSSLD